MRGSASKGNHVFKSLRIANRGTSRLKEIDWHFRCVNQRSAKEAVISLAVLALATDELYSKQSAEVRDQRPTAGIVGLFSRLQHAERFGKIRDLIKCAMLTRSISMLMLCVSMAPKWSLRLRIIWPAVAFMLQKARKMIRLSRSAKYFRCV